MHRQSLCFASLLLAVSFATPVAAAIRGTVITTDGKSIAGAKLDAFVVEDSESRATRLLSTKPERIPVASATSDAKGAFVVETKKEPFIMLTVQTAGYAPSFARLRGEDEIVVALTEAATKSGVIRSGGKPLPNALVTWSGRGELTMVTDAEGRYSVADPDKWANRITVIHPEHAILSEAGGGRFGRKLSVDHNLSKGMNVSGTVVGEDGKTPVAKAQITIDGWPYGATGDDGAFAIERVPEKWREIEATSGALIGARQNTKKAAETIKLTKASTVSGSVREIRTQGALAGAYVTLMEADALGGAQKSTLADAKGNFAFSRVQGGRYRLTASLPGFQVTPVAVDARPRENVMKNLTATEEARVTGYALDDTKKPVAGARIAAGVNMQAMMMRGPMMNLADMPFAAYSGSDGKFIARGLPTDTDLELQAVKKGFPAAKSEVLKLSPGEKKSNVIITIPRGIEVTGLVKDNRGDPVAGVEVNAEETEDGPRVMRRVLGAMADEADPVRTSSDGTFAIRLKEGRYTFGFRKSGFAPKTVRGKSVATNSDPIEVTLSPGVEIRGRVTRSDGSGVADVTINPMSQGGSNAATTAPDGTFTLGDLESGPMMVMAMKPDEMIQEIRSVTAPDDNVVIELSPTGTVSGKILDKSTKQPVTSFRVGATGARSSPGMTIMMPPMLRNITSDDGTFTLDNVRLGALDLIVQAPGYVEGRITGLRLEAGKPLTDVVVELEAGVKLTGKVTGPDGLPLSGAGVRMDQSSGPMMAFRGIGTQTDVNGEYTIEGVAAGDQTFTFSKQGFISEKKEIKLSGKEARLDARLSKGRDVTGVVTTESGMPVAEATIMASSAAQGSSGAMTKSDGNGAFKFEGLAPGRYTFRASRTGYSSGDVKDVDIESHGPIRIQLEQGGVLYGRVLGLTEEELTRATVRASAPGSGGATSPVDANGMYRIEGAPLGSARVEAFVGSFGGSKNTTPKTVQIEPGAEVQVDLEFSSDIVIRGYVSRSGKSAANSMISFMPRQSNVQTRASAQIDSKGNYEVSGLEPGEYDVQVFEMRAFAPYTTTYRVTGSATFDIDIRGSALQGRVVDRDTSEPIADASIRIEPADSGSGPMAYRMAALTDANGRFALESVPEGSYRIRAQKDKYGQQILDVQVTSGRNEEVELKLAKNSGVAIRVLDARDGRVLNARITVRDAGNRSAFDGSPSPNADGDILIPLAPGTYRATITAMNYAPRLVSLTSPSTGARVALSPGGSLVIESRETRTLRAKLLTAGGEEYPRGGFMNPREMAINPGTNRIDFIAPGGYALQILNDDGSVKESKQVTVTEGAAATIEI